MQYAYIHMICVTEYAYKWRIGNQLVLGRMTDAIEFPCQLRPEFARSCMLPDIARILKVKEL